MYCKIFSRRPWAFWAAKMCAEAVGTAFKKEAGVKRVACIHVGLDARPQSDGGKVYLFTLYLRITSPPMTTRWISLVPSKIWKILASRMYFSMG